MKYFIAHLAVSTLMNYLSLMVNEDLHLTLPQIHICIKNISNNCDRQKCLQVFCNKGKNPVLICSSAVSRICLWNKSSFFLLAEGQSCIAHHAKLMYLWSEELSSLPDFRLTVESKVCNDDMNMIYFTVTCASGSC